jgi:hypothetical protein
MQNEKTLQQLTQEYEAQMPPEIMSIIKAFDWKKEVRTIVNQNQLMIDVGTDIEESIYLMILGAIQVADFYERLIDVHELPEDKAQKILQEVENQIFNPLHKKLMELDEKESRAELMNGTPRDQILAEVEKEPEPLIKLNISGTPTKPADPVPMSEGIARPFSISGVKKESVPVVNPVKIPTTPPLNPVQGVQDNPIATGLTQPTSTQTPPTTKPYAADPYREPIE